MCPLSIEGYRAQPAATGSGRHGRPTAAQIADWRDKIYPADGDADCDEAPMQWPAQAAACTDRFTRPGDPDACTPGRPASPAMTSAYEAAKAGGKHAGFLRGLSAMGPRQRSSAVQSFTDQIALHRDEVAFPARYVQGWGALREGHRQSLLKDWRKEVLDHEEQIEIIKGHDDANP